MEYVRKDRVLVIAGFDNSGGAGIIRDIRVFESMGIYTYGAISVNTVQSFDSFFGFGTLDKDMFRKQVEVAIADRVKYVKVGMIADTMIAQEVYRYMKKKDVFFVVDPIVATSSGKNIMKEDILEFYIKFLIPFAEITTPNTLEAANILGTGVPFNIEEVKNMALLWYERFKKPVVITGGHINDGNLIANILYDGKDIYTVSVNRVNLITTHGSGCTFSSFLLGGIIKGMPLYRAFEFATINSAKILEEDYNYAVDNKS